MELGTLWLVESGFLNRKHLLCSRRVSRQTLYPATVSSISVLDTILKSLQSLWEQLAVRLIPLIWCCRCCCCDKTPDNSNLGKEGFFGPTLQWSGASLPGSHGGRVRDRCLRCFQSQEAKSNGCRCSDLCLLYYVICPRSLEMVLPISSLDLQLIQFRNSLTGACDAVTPRIKCLLCTHEDLSLEPQFAH